MTLYGFDISNNQGPGLSLAEIQREGFAWCEMKVSEGDYFADPDWAGYKAQADACGMPIIGYHYAIASCAPAAQVAKFAANGGGNVVMIDFEANSGTLTDYWDLVRAFNAVGITVVLSYLPQWYWEQIGSPDLSQVPGLIASAYPSSSAGYASVLYQQAGGDSGEGWNPYGGGSPVMWQFTDCALTNGTTLDANAFRGSTADLVALLTGQPRGGFMALSDAEQTELLTKVRDIWDQLRGPGGTGWQQLGKNPAGQNLSPVDGEAELITEEGVVLSMVRQIAADVAELKGQKP
ncbi:GH25 family lysozyme [Nocardia niigatensis]|uniref:GH25 family lysozyme n=1 Tax=Nocardia niigatensis TaxID=209249 RepID=UPI00031D0D21|nr:GH25 family lysozyme [Nocardia niigatensis]